jgi:predicted GNAT family N-acyltransferase
LVYKILLSLIKGFLSVTTQIVYKIAESQAEKIEARKVIEDVFVHELGCSSIKPDRFDELSTFIVAQVNGKTIAALRIIPDSGDGLPIEEYIDLSLFRNKNSKLGEVSRLACFKEYRNNTVILKGLSFFKQLAQNLDISHLVIESLLRTANLYRRIGFTPMGEPFFDSTVATSSADMTPNSLAMLMRVEGIRAKMVV